MRTIAAILLTVGAATIALRHCLDVVHRWQDRILNAPEEIHEALDDWEERIRVEEDLSTAIQARRAFDNREEGRA